MFGGVGNALMLRVNAIDGFSGTFKKLHGDIAATDRKTKVMSAGVKAALFGGAVVGFAALAGVVREGIKDYSAHEGGLAKVKQIIKTTGGVANVSAAQVDTMATKMQDYSGFADDVIMQGGAVMLTFKGVQNQVGKGNDIFDRAMKSMADIARAFNIDVPSAAKILGKALEDPVRGMSALRRAGVTFSKSQETMIKSMVASGDMLGAQRFLLSAVEGQVGGVARAYGETLPGMIDRLKGAFSDIAGTIVSVFMPSIESATNWVIAHKDTMIAVANALATGINSAFSAIGTVLKAAPQAWLVLAETVMHVVQNILSGVRLFLDTMSHLPIVGSTFGEMRDQVHSAMGAIDKTMADYEYRLGELTGANAANTKFITACWQNMAPNLVGSVSKMYGEMMSAQGSGNQRMIDATQGGMKGILDKVIEAVPGISGHVGILSESMLEQISSKDFAGATSDQIHQMAIAISAQSGTTVAEVENMLSWIHSTISSSNVSGTFGAAVDPLPGIMESAASGAASSAQIGMDQIVAAAAGAKKSIDALTFGGSPGGLVDVDKWMKIVAKSASNLRAPLAGMMHKMKREPIHEVVKALTKLYGEGSNAEKRFKSWIHTLAKTEARLSGLKSKVTGGERAITKLEKALETSDAGVQAWSDSLENAKSRLSELGSVKLKGMGAAEEKTFRLDMAILAIEKKLLEAKLGQRKLNGGQINQLEDQMEKLQMQRDLVQKTSELAYAPLLRQIEKATSETKEWSFGEVMAEIARTKEEIAFATTNLGRKKAAHHKIEESLTRQKRKVEKLTEAYEKTAKAVAKIKEEIQEITDFTISFSKEKKKGKKKGKKKQAGGYVLETGQYMLHKGEYVKTAGQTNTTNRTVNNNITISAGAYMGSPGDARRFASQIQKYLTAEARR